MKIVIDIPEEEYNIIKNYKAPMTWSEHLIAKGKPLDEVLDKIKSEIERQEKWLLQAGCNTYNVDIAFDAIKSVVAESEE